MSLRVRLIVVFFLLSVVPLGAVTFYSYTSNVRAVRDAAARESDLLAGELSQRMQLVTAQLSERMEHLMDLQNLQATSSAAPTQVARADAPATSTKSPAKPTAPPAPTVPPAPVSPAEPNPVPTPDANAALQAAYGAKVAEALGEAAMLLNNVELRGLSRSGRPPSRLAAETPGGLPPPNAAVPPTPPQTGNATGAPTVTPPPTSAPESRSGTNRSQRYGGGRQGQSRGERPAIPVDPTRPTNPGGAGGRGANASVGDQSPTGSASGERTGGPPPGSGQTAATVTVDPNGTGRLMIDLSPLRREILKQIVPDGQLDHLTPEERQRVGRELNQRMLGIAQGLQLGAVGLQKRAADAEREAAATGAASASQQDAAAKIADAAQQAVDATKRVAESSARQQAAAGAASHPNAAKTTMPAATPAATPAPKAAPAPMRKKTELTGSHLGVMVEENGQIVEQIGAEINMPQVLATVFSTTRRDRGEVPFAIGKDGKIYSPTDDDRRAIEGMKLPVPPAGQTSTTVTKGDWIVVMTADPSGSGLQFGIAKPVADSLSELRKTAARNASFGLGFIGLALVGIVPLSGRLTRNLSRLTEGVDRIAHGDYSARVSVSSKDEVGRLATAFNQMATDVEHHQRAAVEQERVKRELELGRQIQNEMLPHAPLRLGLTEIKGVSVPAREVGGDFFNYFELSDRRIALLVGDVSGKGVGAALLMANIQASLRTRLTLGQDLPAIADAIDRDVDANSPGPVYATLFVAILDSDSRTLQYVNAGHHPQYALCRQGLERMPSTGLPVGLLSGHGYTADTVQLTAGDVLFFYTDGCVEAENPSGDMFGPERLEAVLTGGASASADEVLERVEAAVKAFRDAAEPGDDETLMAVKIG